MAVDAGRLYLTLDALHWEQRRNATAEEKKLFSVDQAYAGNDNGDFFEGGRNVVWACRNDRCTNRTDRKALQGTKRFLKYDEKDSCPHCGSKDIFNWEKETFQTDGELLARAQDGRYRFESWKGEPVNVNHDDAKRIGRIEDVWPEPPSKSIVELISIERQGSHRNAQLVAQIEGGQVDSGSMELLTGIGMCSVCFNVHTTEDDFCQHLKHQKGMVDMKTGMHVFEICKSIQGCGHAIIATGDPADSGALVRSVFAQQGDGERQDSVEGVVGELEQTRRHAQDEGKIDGYDLAPSSANWQLPTGWVAIINGGDTCFYNRELLIVVRPLSNQWKGFQLQSCGDGTGFGLLNKATFTVKGSDFRERVSKACVKAEEHALALGLPMRAEDELSGVANVDQEDPNTAGGDIHDTILDLHAKYKETGEQQYLDEATNLSKKLGQSLKAMEADLGEKYGLTESYLRSPDPVPFDVRKLTSQERTKWRTLRKACTTLNPTNMIDTSLAKPEAKKAARKVDLNKIGRRSAETGPAPAEKPLPNMANMALQMKAFGNFDSTRTAEEVRRAGMSPEERAIDDDFQEFRRAKAEGRSPAIASQPTLDMTNANLKNVFRAAVATRKLTAAALTAALVALITDRPRFTAALATRKLKSNALGRLSTRKAQLKEPDDVEETVIDIIADALINAGEMTKSLVTDSSYEEAADELDDMTSDEDTFKDELEPKEEEPTVLHTDDHKEDLAASADLDDEADKMEKEAAKRAASAGLPNDPTGLKPELAPTKPKDANDAGKVARDSKAGTGSTNGKTETFPAATDKTQKSTSGNVNDGAVLTSLTRRKAALETQIEAGAGDLDQLMDQHQKVVAQMERIKTESTPTSSTDLGGGINENPKGVEEPAVNGGRTFTTEKKPAAVDLGGDLMSNPSSLKLAELLREAGITDDQEVMKITAAQKDAVELTLHRAQMGSVSSGVIAMLKKMGIWPGDKKLAEKFPVGDTETFPEAEDANESPAIREAKRTAQATQAYNDAEWLKNKNVTVKTKVQDMFEHTVGKPTKSEGDQKNLSDQNNGEPTKPGAAEKASDKLRDRSGSGFEGEPDGGAKPGIISDAEQDTNLGRDNVTKPGAAAKVMDKVRNITAASKITAQYEAVTNKGQASASNWTILVDGEPALKVALRDAFPGEVVTKHDTFASEEYSGALIQAVRERGIQAVHEQEFGSASVIEFPGDKKAAQLQPATTDVQPAAPANVDPEVADKIMNDAKPGISTLNLISSLAAPIIVESDTLSVTSFIEDLVNLAQNQDKVTELTTTLNAAVNQLKQSSGLPQENTTGTAPALQAPPVGAAGATAAPQVVQAMANEKKYALLLQAQRITPVVEEEQALGILPNFDHFRKSEKMGSKQAHEAAKAIKEARVAELMRLDEPGYLAVEAEIKKAIRYAKANRSAELADEGKAKQRRSGIWDAMKREAGGSTVLSTVPGESTVASSTIVKPGPKMNFKIAGGINPEKLAEQIQSRNNPPRSRD